MNSLDKTARIAGFLYLVYFPVHIISDAVRDNFIVPGDAAAPPPISWLVRGCST